LGSDHLFEADQKTVLARLPVALGASFDSHAEEHNPICLQDTRVELLAQISDWVDNPQAEAIFWLNGMAGTGKSTICRTVAQTFAKQRCLGASFFFKRGEADRANLSRFFTTIAAQLAVREPSLATSVKKAIDADPTVVGKAVREQFEKLILEPLRQVGSGSQKGTTLVIVIDALDECERDEDVKLLINLFSRAKTLQSPRLRIFVTSRPELPIRLGFSAIKGTYQDLILHEIAADIVEHDISIYLKNQLTWIRSEYNTSVPEGRQLPTTWPSPSDIQILVTMAVPLFIFAATVCRFLSDRKCGSPKNQLSQVLEYRTRDHESQMNATYMPVLKQQIVGLNSLQQERVLEQFRNIVGSIVILETPLSTDALAELLNESQDVIYERLDLLHSVLSIPHSCKSPVRPLHLSFRDFLVSPLHRSDNPFWIDERETHKKLASHCLRIMSKHLKTDICSILGPGTPRSAIDTERIRECLPPELQYACLYWGDHLRQAKIRLDHNDPVYSFFIRHFLHWIEAMSLMGRASQSLEIIQEIRSLCKVGILRHKIYKMLT
jgi:hypothetical protein